MGRAQRSRAIDRPAEQRNASFNSRPVHKPKGHNDALQTEPRQAQEGGIKGEHSQTRSGLSISSISPHPPISPISSKQTATDNHSEPVTGAQPHRDPLPSTANRSLHYEEANSRYLGRFAGQQGHGMFLFARG